MDAQGITLPNNSTIENEFFLGMMTTYFPVLFMDVIFIIIIIINVLETDRFSRILKICQGSHNYSCHKWNKLLISFLFASYDKNKQYNNRLSMLVAFHHGHTKNLFLDQSFFKQHQYAYNRYFDVALVYCALR